MLGAGAPGRFNCLMDPPDKAQPNAEAEFVAAGSEIAGGVVGAGVGLLVGGPPGALAGAATGPVATRGLRNVLADLVERRLSTRERVRSGAVLAVAAVEIDRQLKAGRQLREDGFFQGAHGRRPKADELAEAVVLVAQRDPEEAKVQLLGTLLGRLAFEPRVGSDYAAYLVKAAESLTYRQFCLLALYNLNVRDRYGLRDGMPLKREVNALDNAIGLYQEIRGLHDVTMLQQRSTEHSGTDIILTLDGLNPARQELVGVGGWFYELMDLSRTVPEEDLRRLASELNAAFANGA